MFYCEVPLNIDAYCHNGSLPVYQPCTCLPCVCVLQGVQVPPRGAADRRRVQGAARLRPYGAHATGRPQELPQTPPTR